MSPDDQGLIPAGHDHDPGRQGISRYADPRPVIDLRGGQGLAIGDYAHITNIFRGPGRIAGSAYLNQVRDIAPESLRDRDEELAILARACWTPDLYDWWRADPWAGKSALMATFVLNPPPSVDIVCFFVTARFSGQANSSVFTEALLEQLASMTNEDLPASPIPEVRAAHRAELLRQAAKRCHEQGRRLVLVIDGLDEDTSRRPGSNLPSIASILPARACPGLKVLIASRPSPELPNDVGDDHAIRHCCTHTLTPSPHALNIGRLAKEEIQHLLTEDDQEREILGLIAVSGGLTLPDLQALMHHTSQAEIARHLDSPMGRTVRRRTLDQQADDDLAPYVLAHDTLRTETVSRLGEPSLGEYRDRIYQWADGYRALGWPEDTPAFLIEGYAEMLHRTLNTQRLASLAVDQARHDLMSARTGGDVAALDEVAICQGLLLNESRPDLGTMLRLAAHRDYLNARNARIPADLPVAWIRLGDSRRALGLASMIENDDLRTQAMTALSVAFAELGDADNAVLSARAIRLPEPRVSALIDLVEREFARPDGHQNWRLVDDTVNLAGSLRDLDEQAEALTRLVSAVLEVSEFDRALQCARAITSAPRQAIAQLKVAEAMISHGSAAQGLTLVAAAESGCGLLKDPQDRSQVLCEVASVLGKAGRRNDALAVADRAAATARLIESGWTRHTALDRLADVFAALGDFRKASDESSQASYAMLVELSGFMRGVLKEKGDQLTKILADPDKGSLRLASIKALCAQGRSSEAIALVEDVSDHRERIDADLGLARCLAAAGLIDLAAEATNDAKNRISQIEDAEDKLSALAAMIEASLEARSVEDIETYAGQFLEGIAQIEDAAKRDPRLRKVGRIMLAGGELRWAQRFFEELTGDTKFDCLLELLPQLLEAAEMQAAVVVLNQCLLLTATRSTPAETAEARVRILAAGADRGGTALAAGLVNIVHSLVQDIGDAETRARLLTKVIAPSAHLLPQQAVLRIAHDVESTADEIPQQDPKASVLTDLTHALLDAGLHTRARQAATLAESAGQVDPSSDVRLDDLKDLVKVLLGLGDAHRAAQVAGQIADPGEQKRMLSKIAAWQAAGNPGADELRARGNQDPYLQAVGLLDAARVFAGAGSLRDARRLIPDAERQSRNVKTVHYRLGLWIDLAEVSRAIGETSDAERLAGEVAELLPEVLAAPSRALIMAKLAGVFARLGRPANATEWSHQSENLVLSLSRPSSQAHVLRELAVSVSHWDPGRGHCLLAQALAVGPWPVSLPGLVALDPAALCEVVDSGFQFVPPLHTGMR